ncbi:MAG: cobalamin-dependent protein [Melioribacteraceae bacterium]|nr:cobalamin-dependent protein [Melioribacteraceae bacterium]
MISQQIKSLLQALKVSDRHAANDIVDEYAHENNYEAALQNLVEPALHLFGEYWMKNPDISLANGYIAGKIAEDILLKTAEEYNKRNIEKTYKGIAVVGNIEDDYHSLGRRLVSVFLEASGWEVHDLGNDVLPEEFINCALDKGAKVIGASAMMFVNAKNIKKLRDEIDNRGYKDKLMLAVGGAIFNLRPELVEKVGGDGSAPNAISAVKLFEELSMRSKL